MRNNKIVKNKNNKKSKKILKNPALALHPAFPGQVVKQFKVETFPANLNSTVATGVIALASQVSANQIQNFATRFGALFEEYRIVKCKFVMKCFSSTNPGLFVHWFDEKQNGAPTSTEALQKSFKTFSASSPIPHVITWTASDPLDLQFTDIGTLNVNPVTYKLYTDNANFGSSIVVTPYGLVTATYTVQFRGYN